LRDAPGGERHASARAVLNRPERRHEHDMKIGIIRSALSVALLAGVSSVCLAAPPQQSRRLNPVTLSPRIEPVDAPRTPSLPTPESSPSSFSLWGLYPKARTLQPLPEQTADAAPTRRGIFRVSFPELFPTPVEEPSNGLPAPIPPPPSFEIVDDPVEGAPSATPLFENSGPSRVDSTPLFPAPSEGEFGFLPLEPVYTEEVMVESVTPQTARKWRIIRCDTLHALFKN